MCGFNKLTDNTTEQMRALSGAVHNGLFPSRHILIAGLYPSGPDKMLIEVALKKTKKKREHVNDKFCITLNK